MKHVPYEERAHFFHVFSCLARTAHGLHYVRKGVQIRPEQPDDEVIVVRIEPVACQANVMGKVLVAVGAPNAAMLSHDRALLSRFEPFEPALAPKWVPN